MSLPEEIRLRREAHKLSQIALADAAGVTPQAINRIENGHSPSVRTLEKIATVLGPFEIPTDHGWQDGTPDETCVVYVRVDGAVHRAVYLDSGEFVVDPDTVLQAVDAWRYQ